MIQIADFGIDAVKNYVKASLIKLSNSIGDSLDKSPERLNDLAEDLIDVYNYDSIEDITECLKNGRRGKYGFGHNKRGFVSMALLTEWMGLYLESKAELREKEIEKMKKGITEVENFDAKKFYELGVKYLNAKKEEEKNRKSQFNSRHYDEIKRQYLESRDKPKEDEL